MDDHRNDIPLEIWANVFKHVKNPRDLCQCRLVCKRWDYIAETALFIKELRLTSIHNVSKMLIHLAMKPKRAHLIKHLDFRMVNGDELEVRALLVGAFTPTMESLAGDTSDSSMCPEFFATLVYIVENAPPGTRFRLKKMPHCNTRQMNENYAKAAYAFRNTLQNLDATIDDRFMRPLFDNLKVFKQLRTLDLNGDSIATLDDLESILCNCEKLEVLNLCISDSSNNQQMNTDLTDWIKTHVQQVDNVISLDTDIRDLVVIQYLAYKYPESDYLRCSACFYLANEFSRMVDALKNMQHFETFIFIDDFQDIRRLLADFSRLNDVPTSLVVSIRPTMMSDDDLAAEVEITIENESSRTIQLDVGYKSTSTFDFLALLGYLGEYNANHNLDDITLDTRSFPPFENKEQVVMDAIDIIDRLPNQKKMFLAIDKLQYKPCEPDDRHTNWKMDNLSIYGTTIDSRALAQISQFSPHLNSITFGNCSTVDEYQVPQVLLDINMPQSSLQTMAIEKITRWPASLNKANVNNTPTTEACFVQINLLHQDKPLYLFCSPVLNTIVPTPEAFESLPDRYTCANVKISVADLKRLELKMDSVRTVFDVEKYLAIDDLRKDIIELKLAMENAEETEDLVKDANKKLDEYATRVKFFMGDCKELNSAVFS